ncbi:TfoX/Sxy family protein [Ralstonia pseudosolanacearum]|uniref:TfoX/Sxy family protein n=1 Tax=Ralstonia pseudosolanacearum TaxID=1310165 RepID=UPI0007D73B6C|nr:TfoX/Sxy family protein [Ralstonia pseudosolanacearum]MDC6292185.1 TfoX/Sxy family protein [Ralstonia pseudosolanacearum]MDD7789954.1 TfoX/Sxy family protein [Ralstonia pseudosolanacearum]MDN3369402.1 TfoX/Sxy family protein [Ralstonia pseudosolanacearum]OAK93296.1 competence protein TfoX [Ralstonia pseudosolanacearum]QOK88202.1 TfoX/Sxy family protein [Ralstonia pseudosolanacearum]
MATAPDPLIAWLLDELQPLAAQIGEIRARRMFGGAGLYHDDIVFALVIRGTCYLRVDDATRARFAAEGGTPFQYEREGRTITMTGYLSTPADALDGGQPLRDWVRLAIEAARRAANAKAARPKRAPAKSAAAGQAAAQKKAPARKTTARAKR